MRVRYVGGDVPPELKKLILANRWSLAWRAVRLHARWSIAFGLASILVTIGLSLTPSRELLLYGEATSAERAAFAAFNMLSWVPLLAYSAAIHQFALTFGGGGPTAPLSRPRMTAFLCLGLLLAIFETVAILLLAMVVPPPASVDQATARQIAAVALLAATLSPQFVLATMFPAIIAGGDPSARAALRRGGYGRLFVRLAVVAIVATAAWIALVVLIGALAEATSPLLDRSARDSLSLGLVIAVSGPYAVFIAALFAVTISQHYAEREAALSAGAQ